MFRKFLLIVFIFGLLSCSVDYKEVNRKAAERFRTQLIENKLDEIYDQSENNLKYYISRNEFIENIKLAVETMKEFDESLNWQRDEIADEHRVHEVYNYSDVSWRTMEKDGRKLNITIWWTGNFTFCDLTITEDWTDKPEIVVSHCSKQ